MSRASKLGDRAEARAARVLGTKQLGGKNKGRRVADLAPVRLADGRLLQAEVKARKAHPKFLDAALEQARRYCPRAIPLVMLFARGQRRALVCLDAHVFAELVGLRDSTAGEQFCLALEVPR